MHGSGASGGDGPIDVSRVDRLGSLLRRAQISVAPWVVRCEEEWPLRAGFSESGFPELCLRMGML